MSTGFVADGCDRARAALRSLIQHEVAVQYATRLAAARWAQRAALRRAMEAEIDRRLEQKAPQAGLY